MFDIASFIVLPYVATVLAIVVGILRHRKHRFTWSSLSSQLLEGKQLFWGSVPWHFGIVLILLAHILAFLFPGIWGRLIGHPTRLYILEVVGLSLAFAALVGLIVLVVRRMMTATVRSVTSVMDVVLLVVLLAQVGLGLYTALFFRWGSDWYLHTAVPWLWSLVTLSPRMDYVTALPLVVRLHIIGGFVTIGLFPFTRLVHLVSFPIGYLWRPYQVVRWYDHPRGRQHGGRTDTAGTAVTPGRPLDRPGAGVSAPK